MIVPVEHIDLKQWNDLLQQSATASWFQSPQAYTFYQSVSDELKPFGFGLITESNLKGVCIGYIVGNFFTARAIIQGGVLLADDSADGEVRELLNAILAHLKHKAIYVEMRNLNDYSNYKQSFLQCGFDYRPHLNYIQTTATIREDIDRNRRRNISKSEQNGLIFESRKSNISDKDIDDLYDLLRSLYSSKLMLPLFSRAFFYKLIALDDAQCFIVRHNGKIVGGELCVRMGDKTLYDWYGCGDNSLRDVHPSEYVTFKAIEWARDNHICYFDFMGAGSPDEVYGVRDFKARFGGQPVEYGRYICVNDPIRYFMGTIGVKCLKSIQKLR